MIKVEVLRPFPAGERTLQPGEVVEATGWRNLQRLVELGKVRIVTNLPEAEAESITPRQRAAKEASRA